MGQQNNTQILIIGGPDAGKTHFGGQLYGRLQTRAGLYKILTPPANLTVFKEVLENLNDGRSAGHTNVGANEVLELELEDNTGIKTLLSFPDYGGEQINSIVADRRVDKTWADQLEKSTSWLLFIRPDRLPMIEDIVNRGLPDQDSVEKRNKQTTPLALSAAAFYTELLQMLLFARKTSVNDAPMPRLVIALSCWDLIADQYTHRSPVEVLVEKIPAFHAFVQNTWGKDGHAVIGLSSTERTLSLDAQDPEYIKKGPEKFGYLVMPNGEINRDLTASIQILVGKY
jgi:hypothetical protein